MGKKLLSLLLCLLFVCTALAACGETKIDEARDYINDPNNQISSGRETVTLSFCIPCEFDPTTEESKKMIDKMQENFNAIINAKYRTNVVFTFVKTDTAQEDTAKALADYNAKVNEMLEAGEADIFLTTAYDDYTAKIRGGKLADLTAYVSESWRILSNPKYTEEKKTDYNPTISEAIFSNAYFCTEVFENDSSEKATEHNETYYGIPSNYVVGSYKYLFVRKAEADRSYLGIDFPEDATSSDLNAAALKAKERLTAELKSQGKTDEEIKESYVIDLTGTYGDRFKYSESGDYYVTILSKPEISYADICDTMFCVASASKHTDRAFEVLRELNSNAQLHTILQYGARDVNYTVNQADKTITLKNDAYKMNMKYTGNCLAIYPCTNYADPTDSFYREEMAYASGYENLKYASLQNKDLASPPVPVTNRYKSRLALLSAFNSQRAENENGTSVDGILGNRAVTFKYVSSEKFSIITADGGILSIEVVAENDGYTGCRFLLSYEYSEETDAGAVKRTIETASITQVPQNSYTLKFSYQPSDGERYNDSITLSPDSFTSETKTIDLKDSTYSTFAAETLGEMLDLFSDWLQSSGSGLSLSDFGFTKF